MPKLLIIDDDAACRDLVSEILAKDYEISAAASWSEAFKTISQVPLDLVLLDVNLPGFQGDDIARMIKSSSNKATVLLFSAMDKESLRQKAQTCGADGYLEKSFDPAVLRFNLRRQLRPAPSSR